MHSSRKCSQMSLHNLAICFGPNLFDLEGAEALLSGLKKSASASASATPTSELQLVSLQLMPEAQSPKAHASPLPLSLAPAGAPTLTTSTTYAHDTLTRSLGKSSRSSSLGSLHGRLMDGVDALGAPVARSASRERDLDISLPVGAGACPVSGGAFSTPSSDSRALNSNVALECTLLMLHNYRALFAVSLNITLLQYCILINVSFAFLYQW